MQLEVARHLARALHGREAWASLQTPSQPCGAFVRLRTASDDDRHVCRSPRPTRARSAVQTKDEPDLCPRAGPFPFAPATPAMPSALLRTMSHRSASTRAQWAPPLGRELRRE